MRCQDRTNRLRILLLPWLFLIASVVGQAAVLRVPESFLTIQAAIDQAVSGDVIEVDALGGPYREAISINQLDLTIRAVNGTAMIDGREVGRLVEFGGLMVPIVVEIAGNAIRFSGFEVRGDRERGVGILLSGTHRSFLIGNTIRGHLMGVLFHDTEGSVLMNNTIENNLIGVIMRDARESVVLGNMVRGNGAGLWIQRSDENRVVRNTIEENGNFAIFLTESNYNTMEGNSIRKNQAGIGLVFSIGNSAQANRIEENGSGIRLLESQGNAIHRNTIAENQVGIDMESSGWDNLVRWNNIVDNEQFGVHNVTGMADVTENWWGDPSGPSGEGLGLGDPVSTQVEFGSWLKAPIEIAEFEQVEE